MKALKNLNPAIVLVAVAALLVALMVAFWPGSEKKFVTAEFPRAVSLYKGSDVKILGIAVGKIESVKPSGTRVLVKMSYDSKYKVPADAKAAVISPSIVGDRFVQLTPVYRSGAELADGARLGVERTATPLELDEIFGSLNDLNIALGPEGANAPGAQGVGALTRLLQTTAANFGGQGAQFNQTIKNLGKLTKTLSDNKDELFGTTAEIEKFVKTLAQNDDTVRAFTDSLAAGANLLAGERDDLAAALRNLGVAMQQVRGFVQENKTLLTSNITKLTSLSRTLVKRRAALDEILKVAPTALNNLSLAYNPVSGTLDTRDNLGGIGSQLSADPATVLCTFVSQAPGGSNACNLIKSALSGAPRTGALTAGTTPATVAEPLDRTLGGLVEVQ